MLKPLKLICVTLLPLLLGLASLSIAFSAYLRHETQSRLSELREKQESIIVQELRGRIESVHSIITHLADTGRSKDDCREIVSSIRFGDSNYIWVHQLDESRADSALMLVHAADQFVGKDMSGLIDLDQLDQIYHNGGVFSKGSSEVVHVCPTNIFAEFNRACLADGEGVVRYYWPKVRDGKTSSIGYLKMSYVKYFPRWRWVIGAGSYADHIDRIVNREEVVLRERAGHVWLTVLLTFLLVGGTLGGLGYIMSRRIAKGIQQHEQAMALSQSRLEAAKVEAEAAAKTKGEFLANMSHEIRTPMTAILGFTENLLDPDLPEADREHAIHTVRRNGEHLLAIINDILDISKIEAGKLTIERVPSDPMDAVRDVYELMNARSAAKGLSFEVECIGGIPKRIETDPTRLKQILVNLTANAVKFTETGGVRLAIRLAHQPTSDGPAISMLQFDVIDTGIGMNPEQVSRLFNAFSQADTSMTRRFGGTGLGLSISQRLARILGGNITVVSAPGAGSTFRLRVMTGPLDNVPLIENPALTLAHPASLARDSEASTRPLSNRILLAEDGLDNQRLIAHILRKAGADVTVVENGKLARDAALEAHDVGEPFDVILMDMQMPIMDGYEATRQLRLRGYTGTIVALTAHAMSGDRDLCLRAGCDGYATKPIDRDKLISLLHEYASGISAT